MLIFLVVVLLFNATCYCFVFVVLIGIICWNVHQKLGSLTILYLGVHCLTSLSLSPSHVASVWLVSRAKGFCTFLLRSI